MSDHTGRFSHRGWYPSLSLGYLEIVILHHRSLWNSTRNMSMWLSFGCVTLLASVDVTCLLSVTQLISLLTIRYHVKYATVINEIIVLASCWWSACTFVMGMLCLIALKRVKMVNICSVGERLLHRIHHDDDSLVYKRDPFFICHPDYNNKHSSWVHLM